MQKLINDDAPVYLFQGSALLIRQTTPVDNIPPGVSGELIRAAFAGELLDWFDIPALDGTGRFSCCSVEERVPMPASWQAVPMRRAVSLLADAAGGSLVQEAGIPCPGQTAAAAGRLLRAFHIAQWRRQSVFCGSCGSRNTDSPVEFARLCPVCGRLEFPRIAPAIIVLITNDAGEALLAHNKNFSPGVYSLIAGFVEAGESMEAAVAREVREEVSIELKDIRYQASQSWPFPNSLMLGFTARHSGGVIQPDGQEIVDARWYSRDALPDLPGAGSIARYLIEKWRTGYRR